MGWFFNRQTKEVTEEVEHPVDTQAGDFKPGDVVELASGGPHMVISERVWRRFGYVWSCHWWNYGKYETVYIYESAILKKVANDD